MSDAGVTTSLIEGKLRIEVKIDADVVSNVYVRSQRPVNCGALLEGRSVEDAIDLLPRIFSLCGVAQTVAGLEAVEHALGITLTPPQTAARRLLVAAEALGQTVWRITVDWPTCLDIRPDVSGIRELRRQLRGFGMHMFAAAPWHRVGGSHLISDPIALINHIDAVAQQTTWILFGDTAPKLDDHRSFECWLGQRHRPGPSALDYVRDQGLAAFGNSPVDLLPKRPDISFFAHQLANDGDLSFCTHPHYHGSISETGALSRQVDHPLVSQLQERYGSGLLTRLAARLVETNQLISKMRSSVAALCEDVGTVADEDSGQGISMINTARGALLHWVDIVDNMVNCYRILAPTEWNFHPQGPLIRGLQGAEAHVSGTLHKSVGLLINALDPCVGYELNIGEH
jgi:hypothetical protein